MKSIIVSLALVLSAVAAQAKVQCYASTRNPEKPNEYTKLVAQFSFEMNEAHPTKLFQVEGSTYVVGLGEQNISITQTDSKNPTDYLAATGSRASYVSLLSSRTGLAVTCIERQ
jgi:hypothetical protein